MSVEDAERGLEEGRGYHDAIVEGEASELQRLEDLGDGLAAVLRLEGGAGWWVL